MFFPLVGKSQNSSAAGMSQNLCTCDILLEDVGNCCYELKLNFSDTSCNQLFFNQITVNSNFFSGFTCEIVSVASALSTVTASINATNDLATFSSSVNLVTPASLSGYVTIGTICFANAPAGLTAFDLIASSTLPPAVQCGVQAEFVITCQTAPPITPWDQLCGDTAYNSPTKIKAFDDGVYLAGVRRHNDLNYATFSKYDLTGALQWLFEMSEPSIFHDFEYVPATDEFLLVGATEPFQLNGVQQNNQSLLVKVNDAGTLISSLARKYEQTGREHFNRILRHPTPKNPAFPYYIVGTINPASSPSPPSAVDLVTLANIDANGNFNWYNTYNYAAASEVEVHRGIFPLTVGAAQGDLVITGNDIPANDGILISLEGQLGGVQAAYRYASVLDIYDGVQLPSGEIMLAGADFGNQMAFIGALNSNFALSAVRMTSILEFREIGLDAQGRLYAVGPEKNAPNRNVMHRFVYNPLSVPPFTVAYQRYLENPNEDAYASPKFSVTPAGDFIFYADARRETPSVFGNFDLAVGVFDLDFSAACVQDFVGGRQPFNVVGQPISVVPQVLTLPSPTAVTAQPINYSCQLLCDTCSAVADFDFFEITGFCFTFQFVAMASGTPPFQYAWDFDGDPSTVESADDNPVWSFPFPGVYSVCLTVTDADGCTATYCEQVPAFDFESPILDCPDNVTIGTDPGVCVAAHNPLVTAIDNCDLNPTINCVLSGATTGTVINTLYNKGLTTCNCEAMDFSGNVSNTCTFNVTVLDNQPPIIVCPPAIVISAILACEGGATVTLPPPVTLTDNCPMVSYASSHPVTDFYACNTSTTVVYTATDMAGLVSSCAFPIVINCVCAQVTASDIECSATNPRVFAYSVTVEDLTGSTGVCTAAVSTSQSGVTVVSNPAVWSGDFGTITGTVTVTSICVPNNISLVVNLSCPCPNGVVNCAIPFTLATPCCFEIEVDDATVCKDAAQFTVPLVGCTVLPGVQQVRWYVSYPPCPPVGDPAWGVPYQVTNNCNDLLLLPEYLSGDVCVYAEVQQGACGGPCTLLTSNVATITLCKPVSCSITSTTPPELCSNSVPGLVTLGVNYNPGDCDASVQWYNHAGVLLGQTSNTLSVTGLSFANAPISGPDDCWREYLFGAIISQPCGDQNCEYRIRIFDNDAAVGTLSLLPPDLMPPPFCPGEDAQILYSPECAAYPPAPPMWKWHTSTNGSSFTQMSSAGMMNPLFNTNKLYQDTWYRIKKNNGVCPPDEVTFMIDVYSPLSLGPFTVNALDLCMMTGLHLQMFVLMSSGCGYIVEWYKDGNLIHTSTHSSSPASYVYTDATLNGDYSGNYYAIVKDLCCPDQIKKSVVVTVGPPCKAAVLGPCFRCDDEIVTLTGIIINPPSTGGCTYQWYIFNTSLATYVPLLGETGLTLDVNQGNTWYRFEANCNGCVKTVDFYLKQCLSVSVEEIGEGTSLKIMPNPTSGLLTVILSAPAKEGTQIRIADAQGKVVQVFKTPTGIQEQGLDLSVLPSGIYFIQHLSGERLLGTAKVVKE
jgi:PKD repeat protein